MGEKDITEKSLENLNDVFSDIVNGLIFHGIPVIREDELCDIHPESYFKGFDDKVHSVERDTLKRWRQGMINIAMIGIENQTDICDHMPIRMISYDGNAYRAQLSEHEATLRKWDRREKQHVKADHVSDTEFCRNIAGEKCKPKFHPIPVLSIILYFGKDHWNRNLYLKDLLDIPKAFEPYINDYKINVFEVAWLSEEEISKFCSDFRIIADFFSKRRTDPNYIPKDTYEIVHVTEFLNLMTALTGDKRYQSINDAKNNEIYGGGPKNMCEVADRLEKIGRQKGRREGRREGIHEGEERINILNQRLISENRLNDLIRSITDTAYQNKLMVEYGIRK